MNYYSTLNDASDIVPELAVGNTEVWYSKNVIHDISSISPETLKDTHVCIGKVKETSPERLFMLLQGEHWSPNGEACEFIEASGAEHTSMMVGDVLVIHGKVCVCDRCGFVMKSDVL